MSTISSHLLDNVRNSGTSHLLTKPEQVSKSQSPSIILPPPHSQFNATPRMQGHYIIDDEILGLAAVDHEDKEFVNQLLVFAITIKCPDKQYDSMSYERPVWSRVEPGTGEYLLLLGGWKSIGISHLQLIKNFDCQAGDARNIIDVEVVMAAPNTNPHAHDLTIVIRYKTEAQKRRHAARLTSVDENYLPVELNSIEPGAARKKRGLVGTLFDFVVNGV